jgi:hypothetical protein
VRSWYRCDIEELLGSERTSIVARLALSSAERGLDASPEAILAWHTTLNILQEAGRFLSQKFPPARDWRLCLEFEIPRRRRRIDAILLADELVFLIELKAGKSTFDRADRWQVEQYALDLRDFHAGSHDRVIIPILVASNARSSSVPGTVDREAPGVLDVQALGPGDLGPRVLAFHTLLHDPLARPTTADSWEDAPYRPTPSIVEAAVQLYQSHDVREISASDAQNLDLTVDAVLKLVEQCRRQGRRGIAFITGAPGSGKTLAGLQVVHDQRLASDEETAGVFLSGNMPLVEVISSALVQAELGRDAMSRQERLRRVSAFIQHAYAFRNEYAEHGGRVPHEHVVLFDEAQRAWDAEQVSRWTRGQSSRSEPHILLDVMSRVPGWAVVVAMVGGGQEINRGEAGLKEWGRALAEHHDDWLVYASSQVLPGSPAAPGGRLFEVLPQRPIIASDARLHLTMNV